MRKFVILLFLAVFCFQAHAQEKPLKKGWLVQFETRATAPFSDEEIKLRTLDFDATIGYAFDRRLTVHVPLTATAGLFKIGKAKSYQTPMQLGVGIGYDLLHGSDEQLELAAKAGSTLGGDWQFLYYDLELRYFFTSGVSVGVGVRYFDTYKGGFKDHCNFYGAVGFRLFTHKMRFNE